MATTQGYLIHQHAWLSLFSRWKENKCLNHPVLCRRKIYVRVRKGDSARERWRSPYVDKSRGRETRDVCWIYVMGRGVSWQCSGHTGTESVWNLLSCKAEILLLPQTWALVRAGVSLCIVWGKGCRENADSAHVMLLAPTLFLRSAGIGLKELLDPHWPQQHQLFLSYHDNHWRQAHATHWIQRLSPGIFYFSKVTVFILFLCL